MKINNSILFLILICLLPNIIKSQSEIEKEIEQLDKATEKVEKDASKSSIKKDKNDSDDEKTKIRKMTINADLNVLGGITCTKLTADSADISGSVHIAESLKAHDIKTDKLTTQILVTEKIVSPTGVLTLAGDLVINSDVAADGISMRGSSLVLEGVKQWGLFHHDDFETEESLDGWSMKRVSRCKEGGNNMLLY
jgi:hypothetical protein